MTRYYERALDKLRADLKKTFPGQGLRACVRDDERLGVCLVVHGKNVPPEVYYCLERALVDKRHPYVDLTWISDPTDKFVVYRVGVGCAKPDKWYRTVEEQIEIEKSMDEAYEELAKAETDLLAKLQTAVPCRIEVRKEADKRKVLVATILPRSYQESLKKPQQKRLINRIHAIVGECFHGDGSNEFDLESCMAESSDEVAYLTTAKLRGRGPFSNPLFAAIERERKAFSKICRAKSPKSAGMINRVI